MTTIAINTFDGYDIRHVFKQETSEPIWVARDVCEVIGIAKYRDAVAQLDEDERVSMSVDTPGGRQNMIGVTEAGVWSLMLISRSPIVKPFKRWLTHEVLPQIRKTGGYGHQPLQGPELLAAAVLESQKMIEARDARIYQLESKAVADAPKVTYVDTYVTDADLLSFSTVASTNNVTEKWLRDLLIAKDWIYVQTDSRWSEKQGKKVTRNRYSEKADKKRYFRRVEVHEAPRFRGSEVMHTLKITPAGAEAIARLVAKEVAA